MSRNQSPSPVDRILLVKQPWADLLVDGIKTWEMRRSATNIRGPVGIAASGSGTIIGSVDLVDCHGPFQPDELVGYQDRHRVPLSNLEAYSPPKGLYAWEVASASRFDEPVVYDHPQGAVIWVKLDPPN